MVGLPGRFCIAKNALQSRIAGGRCLSRHRVTDVARWFEVLPYKAVGHRRSGTAWQQE